MYALEKSAAAISRRPWLLATTKRASSAKAQAGSSAAGSARAMLPPKRAAIAHGEVGHVRHGLREQWQVLAHDRRIGDLHVTCEGADPHLSRLKAYALERIDPIDIDEQFGLETAAC